MRFVAYLASCLFIFSIPWENTVVIPGFGTISRLLGIVAVVLAFLAVVVSGQMRRWQAVHFAALLFMVWTTITLFGLEFQSLPRKFQTYVQLLALLLMLWELARARRQQLGLFAAYVFGAYVAAFSTIMVYRTAAGRSHRFAAEGFDPNDLAMNLALALPMAWYLGMTYRSTLVRWVCRGYLPVGLIALGLTGSRGGMLAAMVALLIVPLTLTHLSPGKVAIGIALLVLSGTLAITYVPETAMERLATTGSEMSQGSYGGRLRIWRAGVLAFAQQPIVGHGVGSYQASVRAILGWGAQYSSHNSMLSVLVEQGLVGFTFYAAMFVSVFLAVLRLPLLERRFGLVLMTALFVAMLPLGWEDSKTVWFVLAALIGLCHAWPETQGGRVPSYHPGRTAGSGREDVVAAPVRSADRNATR